MKVFVSLGILSATLLLGFSSITFSSSDHSEKELMIQKSVVDTFKLNAEGYKPLFTKDIYDPDSEEPSEIRLKVASAIDMLTKSNDLKVGDYKPMTFIKGNKVLIGIMHSDDTITLTEFDISKEKPAVVDKQNKEVKK